MNNDLVWEILKKNDGPNGAKTKLWSGSLLGFENWIPTPEQIKFSLNDEDSVAIRVWENSNWVPTSEQVEFGLQRVVGVRRAVLWNRQWVIKQELAEDLAERGNPYEQIAVWSRKDWQPSTELVENILKKESFLIKQIAWLREDWSQNSAHVELLFNAKEQTQQCRQLIWQRKPLEYTAEQFLNILTVDVKSSGDIHAANEAFLRDDWPKNPEIIKRGLEGDFLIKKERWEPYRSILEAHLLKERCGIEKPPPTPHSVL